ncbi:Gfo/Idh/MocA family protein [Haloarchaeobius sp. TZWSO28]|uniref:Gfo/Idh/MocA family protein n=1 Tax=Haloarchaeobius sp. TZWSO28 TaxID=3446119 RepID=UPI003EB77369
MTTPIGICSTAHLHSHAYATILDSLETAEFVGVVDEDPERGESFATEHDVPLLDEAELFEEAAGVAVCSSNADHLRWVRAAAAAGVDVLSEKPLSPTVSDAAEAVEVAEAADIALGVAMPLRFSRPVRRAKDALESGDLGSLRSITGTNRGQMPGSWFVDPAESGGGATMDHTVHIVDVVHWLTGQRVAEVYAETDTRFHDIGVEDVNVLSMCLDDGTTFSLDGSWSKPNEWDTWGDATVELVATDGVVSVDCFAQTFKHTTEAGIQSVYWGDDANEGLIEDFVEAVETGRDPETTGRDGVDAVAVVEAAYESAERGEPVPVEYTL